MSWDVFVQSIPEGVQDVRDIPDDFVPDPLGPRDVIVAGIRDVFPAVDFSDPEWGHVEGDGYSIEISLNAEDPVKSFALHVRGDTAATDAVAALLDRLGLRAFDPQSPTGIFASERSDQGFEQWRAYRDEIVAPERPTPEPDDRVR